MITLDDESFWFKALKKHRFLIFIFILIILPGEENHYEEIFKA